jgi:hypothetical protein
MPRSGPSGETQNSSADMIDKDISFDRRDMHKTWPFAKGCLMLLGMVLGFIWLSIYVFRTFL